MTTPVRSQSIMSSSDSPASSPNISSLSTVFSAHGFACASCTECLIQIDRERFHKLVTALRTAVANEYNLDKEVSVFNDILDAFRMALTFYKRTK